MAYLVAAARWPFRWRGASSLWGIASSASWRVVGRRVAAFWPDAALRLASALLVS